jgi:hypothetical protein
MRSGCGRVPLAALLGVVCLLGGAWTAAAQGPPQGPVADLGPVELGIKGRVSLMVSGGLDLDLFGNVVSSGVSCDSTVVDVPTACNTQTRILQAGRASHYPDIYVSTPRRWHASIGIGFAQKDELIVQVSGNRSAAEEGVAIGEVITAAGNQPLRATFTSYKDLAIEGGIRHYFKSVGRSKSYVSLLYGRRRVEAMQATLSAAGGIGNLGTVRFYDTATVNTGAAVFGVTYERGPIGGYLEAGFRWTAALPQADADLDQLGIGMFNDAGSRVFMPASIGLLLRF